MIVWPTKPCGYDYCRPSNYGKRLSGLIRAAVAVREADPWYGYYGYGYRPYGYGNGYGHGYGFGNGFGYYGKRSADVAANLEDKAEPEYSIIY